LTKEVRYAKKSTNLEKNAQKFQNESQTTSFSGHSRRCHVCCLRSHRPQDLPVHEGEEEAAGKFLWRSEQRMQEAGRHQKCREAAKKQNRETRVQEKVNP